MSYFHHHWRIWVKFNRYFYGFLHPLLSLKLCPRIDCLIIQTIRRTPRATSAGHRPMGPGCPCTHSFGASRIQGPNCLYLLFLRIVFAASNLEGWGSVFLWCKQQICFTSYTIVGSSHSVFLSCCIDPLCGQHLAGSLHFAVEIRSKGTKCKQIRSSYFLSSWGK